MRFAFDRRIVAALFASLIVPLAAVGEPATQPANLATMADDLQAMIRSCRAIDGAIPRDTFDIAAALQGIDRLPEKLFAWVRDQTRFMPYAGILRGADGTLIDRSGKRLDRALLLARLLKEAGHLVRLRSSDACLPFPRLPQLPTRDTVEKPRPRSSVG